MFFSALLFSLFHILLYNSNQPIISGFLIVASGISHSIWWISILVYLQTISDEKYKGRVVGFYFSLLVSVSVGSILGGLISEFIGIRPTVYFAMACLMAIHSFAFMSPTPGLPESFCSRESGGGVNSLSAVFLEKNTSPLGFG